MNKDEILKRAKDEYRLKDEREEHIEVKAFQYGACGMFIAFIILALCRFFIVKESILDLLVMFEALLASMYFYKYSRLKKNTDLFKLAIWGLAAVLNLITYLMQAL